MKRTAIAAFVMLASVGAHADYITDYVHAEVGAGVTHYATIDGRWYQQGMPTGSEVQRTNAEFSLGLTGPIVARGRWGVDWHVDYVNLGRAAADCQCTPDDRNYDPKRHVFTKKIDVQNAFFTGSGRSQGVALTVEPYYWWQGLRWGAEVGAYVHRDNWKEYVAGWAMPGQAPQSFELNSSYWSVAPVVGVNIGNGRVSLAYRHYFMTINSNKASTPPLWNDADVLEIKVKF